MNTALKLYQMSDRQASRLREPAAALRVLIVTDSTNDFLSLNKLLKMPIHQRYDTVHCDTFEDAESELKSPRYDIALVDYQIDARFGIELIQEIEGDLPVPVIMLTSSEKGCFTDIEQRALEVGAFDMLEKCNLSCSDLTRSIRFAIKRFETELEIRERELALRRAHERSEAANFSKSEFLAHLSHEIRTPLNAIVGFSQVLKDDTMQLGIDEKYRDYAETVHNSGLHLLDILEDLLDLTETNSEAYGERVERFKRYRTWILDREETRRAVRRDI